MLWSPKLLVLELKIPVYYKTRIQLSFSVLWDCWQSCSATTHCGKSTDSNYKWPLLEKILYLLSGEVDHAGVANDPSSANLVPVELVGMVDEQPGTIKHCDDQKDFQHHVFDGLSLWLSLPSGLQCLETWSQFRVWSAGPGIESRLELSSLHSQR